MKNKGFRRSVVAGLMVLSMCAVQMMPAVYAEEVTEGTAPKDGVALAQASKLAKAKAGEGLDTLSMIRLGTQSDSTKASKTGTNITLDTSTYGKMANTGQSGFVAYAAKISKDENATIRGRFHVKDAKKVDNQSSFGLIAFDTLGKNDTSTDYVNQVACYAATKVENPELSIKTIPGVRTVSGNTDKNGTKKTDETVVDMNNVFDAGTAAFTMENATKLYYNFELVKTCNGITLNWYSDDWSKVANTIEVTNPNKLLAQDPNGMYIGFFASRIGVVEVTDASFEKHTPSAEEIAKKDISTWINYDEAEVSTFNGATCVGSEYTYRGTTNVTGKYKVTDESGKVYYENDVKGGDAISFTIHDLPTGSTTFTTSVTPAENSVDETTLKKQYDDRLLLKDYSPITVADAVLAKSSSDMANVYVSPTAKANGTGAEDSPMQLQTALNFAEPGQCIILQDGVYKPSKQIEIPYGVSGTEQGMITLRPQNEGKVTFDGSQMKGTGTLFAMKGDYWHVYGIEIVNSQDGAKAVTVAGNNNIVEMLNIHNNGSSGLQISRASSEPNVWWPNNNQIINCTSYFNADSKQNDADGFSAKLSVGEGNVFNGCISHDNVDDGYDLYAKNGDGYGPIGAVTIENCLAYHNGYTPEGNLSKASGNGFKLGGEGLSGKHVLKNSIAWANAGCGITSNNGPDCKVYNSESVDNGAFSRVDGGQTKRNNIQLSPKNGDKFAGTTDYEVKNTISFYTPVITNPGTMSGDTFTLKSQQLEKVVDATNYVVNDPSTRSSKNSENKSADASWFKEIDYAKVQPARNADGTINLNGLFEMTDKAPQGLGASVKNPTSKIPALSNGLVKKASSGNVVGSTGSKAVWPVATVILCVVIAVGGFFVVRRKRA